MTLEINPSDFKNLAVGAQDDGVWIVTLNRPTKRNALDIDTIEELVDFFTGPARWCAGGGSGGRRGIISVPVSI